MGREPANSAAVDGYELEDLAIHIVYCPKVRDFRGPDNSNALYRAKMGSPDALARAQRTFRWKIELPELGNGGPTGSPSTSSHRQMSPNATNADDATSVAASGSVGQRAYPNITGTALRPQEPRSGSATWNDSRSHVPRLEEGYFSPASSEQLVRVRKRLGDLCQWPTKTSTYTISLCRSIEAFMEAFFPVKHNADDMHSDFNKDHSNKTMFEWKLIARGPEGNTDTIAFQIHREQGTGKWKIATGKVDAVISLWVATVEAELKESQHGRKKAHEDRSVSSSTQQHTPSATDFDWIREGALKDSTNIRFFRVLGDNNDGVLKRDLGWWVGDRIFLRGFSHDADSEIPIHLTIGLDRHSIKGRLLVFAIC